MFGADGDEDTELSQDSPDGIDASGPGSEPSGAESMQGGEGLLVEGFDRDGSNVPVSVSLEKAFGIGAVRLVSTDVWLDVVRGEKDNVVTVALELSGPVVSHAASLHDDMSGFALGEEWNKPRAGEAMGFGHLAGVVRDGELEDVLCNIHGNRRMLHFGLLLLFALMKSTDSGTLMPTESKEESIPSLQRTIGPGILARDR